MKKRNKRLAIFLFGFVLLTSCNQTEIESESFETQSAQTQSAPQPLSIEVNEVSRPQSYVISRFSDFIFVDDSHNTFLIEWDFFPGAKFDSQNKVLTLPCEIEYTFETPEGLSVSQSLPVVEEGCQSGVAVSLENAQFEVYGLVFEAEKPLDLTENIGFLITNKGFMSHSGSLIETEATGPVRFEDVFVSL